MNLGIEKFYMSLQYVSPGGIVELEFNTSQFNHQISRTRNIYHKVVA